ncbi:hypothetical protein [Aminobacter sp. MSH1]|uniref:hypothetical protein n=1 Tax=Aminobacter sp. MSH1 TaxID=374606 RepID=UPI00131F1C9E|nr:hypothetical protein [Aminobacter sp. MSH1]
MTFMSALCHEFLTSPLMPPFLTTAFAVSFFVFYRLILFRKDKPPAAPLRAYVSGDGSAEDAHQAYGRYMECVELRIFIEADEISDLNALRDLIKKRESEHLREASEFFNSTSDTTKETPDAA